MPASDGNLRARAPKYREGDLLVFAGADAASRGIALATCSPWQLLKGHWFSHIAIVAKKPNSQLLLAFESTTFCKIPCAITGKQAEGVQAHYPDGRVRTYAGRVWRLRLVWPLAVEGCRDAGGELSDFLMGEIAKPYDYEWAVLAGTRRLRLARSLNPRLDRLICSGLVMAALQRIRVVDRDLNSSSYSPARAVRDLTYWGTYQPIGAGGSESVRLK